MAHKPKLHGGWDYPAATSRTSSESMIRRPLLNSLLFARTGTKYQYTDCPRWLWYGRYAYRKILLGIILESPQPLTPDTWNVPEQHRSKCVDMQALIVKFHDYNSSYVPAFLHGEI